MKSAFSRHFAFFFILVAACATSSPRGRVDSNDEVLLTIVGTNDLHGWVEPRDRPLAPDGEPLVGGIDMFGGYLDVLRQKRPDGVVLLDGGDLFQGTLVVNETEGEVVINAYDALRYDAVAIGNHEFDYGPVGPQVVALSDDDDPLGNIKKRIEQASFPILVGNVFEKATDRPVRWKNARRTALVTRQGVKVGIIGLATPTTPSVTLLQNVETLDFKPLAPTALELAARLRERGAEVIVLVMHAGGTCEGEDPHETHACDTRSEIWDLLHALPEGTVDAVVAGHTHQYLSHFINGVPSIQSGSFGAAFGVIELVYDRKAGKVTTDKSRIWAPTPICRRVFKDTGECLKGQGELVKPSFLGETVEPNEHVASVVRPDVERVAVEKAERLGPVLEHPFGRARMAESALGSFVADVMRAQFDGADAAFTNSGGLRADLATGPLTYGDVFNALPFDNRIAELDVTGRELKELLRLGVAGKHGIMQVSGLRVAVSEDGTTACDGSRLVDLTLADGSPIDDDARYLALTNDFIAGGGDGYAPFLAELGPDRIRVRHDLPPLREMVATHFRAHPSITGPADDAPRIPHVRPDCEAASDEAETP